MNAGPDDGAAPAGFDRDDTHSWRRRGPEPYRSLDFDGGLWLIAGYPELRDALRDEGSWTCEHDLPNGATDRLGVMNPPSQLRARPVEMDPPGHADFRRLLWRHLSPDATQQLRPLIRDYTDWCLDQHVESGRMELFDDVAALVPALVTMRLIGLPETDARIAAQAVHNRATQRFGLTPQWQHLVAAVEAEVARRRADPVHDSEGDVTDADLLTTLSTARIEERPLSTQQIVEVCFGVVVGGLSTTAKLVLGALTHLSAHPQARAGLLDGDGSRLRTAVQEWLRYYSPVPFLSRTARCDTQLGARTVRAGERVAFGFAAANRDPRVFEHPDDIDLDRADGAHLALGHGSHYCVGSHLGCAETEIILEQVLRRLPDFRADVADGDDANGDDADGEDAAGDDANGDDAAGGTRRRPWRERLANGLPVTFTPGPRVGPPRSIEFATAPTGTT